MKQKKIKYLPQAERTPMEKWLRSSSDMRSDEKKLQSEVEVKFQAESCNNLGTHCLPGCAGAGEGSEGHPLGWWSTALRCSSWWTSSGWWCSHCERRGNPEQWWPRSHSLEHPPATPGAGKFKHGWALIRSCVYLESKRVWLPKPS